MSNQVTKQIERPSNRDSFISLLMLGKQKIQSALIILICSSIFISARSDAKDLGDPKDKGCLSNTKIVVSNSTKNIEYNVMLTVEMRFSPICKTRWVRAFIPSGTKIYFKDSSGEKYVEYTAKVNGWNYTNMENRTNLMQACAKYPGKREELCTSAK
jgi:hypothetical protein